MDEIQSDPGIAIFLEGKMGGDRGFRFQTVISRECTTQELSALFDKLRNEADRQDALYTLKTVSGEIETETKKLLDLQADVDRISRENVRKWHESGKKGDPSLTSKERESLAHIDAGILAKQNRIRDLQAVVATCQAKVDGRLN